MKLLNHGFRVRVRVWS